MECVLTGDCPYITYALQKLIDEAPWGIEKDKARKIQRDAIENLTCGETIGELVCCAKKETPSNDLLLFILK